MFTCYSGIVILAGFIPRINFVLCGLRFYHRHYSSLCAIKRLQDFANLLNNAIFNTIRVYAVFLDAACLKQMNAARFEPNFRKFFNSEYRHIKQK